MHSKEVAALIKFDLLDQIDEAANNGLPMNDGDVFHLDTSMKIDLRWYWFRVYRAYYLEDTRALYDRFKTFRAACWNKGDVFKAFDEMIHNNDDDDDDYFDLLAEGDLENMPYKGIRQRSWDELKEDLLSRL